MPAASPSQTIGPFFHEALKWAIERSRNLPQSPDAVQVSGRVLDGDAKPVSDALLEVWQPGSGQGEFGGLQRAATDDDGRFAFFMRRPVKSQTHADVTVFARGLLIHVFTRVYLHSQDDLAGVSLPSGVPAERRATLLATRCTGGDGYQWDIHLQGPRETVFFQL